MHLTVEARIENVDDVTEFVDGLLDGMGCSLKSKTQINIALDELFANICSYAYGDGMGEATIRVSKVPNNRTALDQSPFETNRKSKSDKRYSR